MTFRERLANMHNAGGNHPAQTTQGILKEGQYSYLKTIDNNLGTSKAPDPHAKQFRHIEPPTPPKTPPSSPKK